MKIEFIQVADKICRESEIALRLSDIVEVITDENIERVTFHCLNHTGMFEFFLEITALTDGRYMTLIYPVKNSPYSCDAFVKIVRLCRCK